MTLEQIEKELKKFKEERIKMKRGPKTNNSTIFIRLPQDMNKKLVVITNGRSKSEVIRQYIEAGLKKESEYLKGNLKKLLKEVSK